MRIVLTPEEVQTVGNKLKQTASDIEAASQSAASQVDSLRDMESPALHRNIDNWDQLYASIREAVSVLNEVAEIYVQVAIANIEANK